MDPTASLPALPFTVGADRAGARRRALIAWPVLLLASVGGGAALGVLYAALMGDPDRSAWVLVAVVVVALTVFLVARPHAKAPPQDDWLFRLEPDGLRFPPGVRARRTAPGHPGLLLPWPLITSSTPRSVNGQPAVIVTIRPEAEAVLLAQGCPAPQARVAAAKGFRLRLAHGDVPPAQCLRLIELTHAARVPPQ